MRESRIFNDYNYKSVVIEGEGVDMYISYVEWKDGTPLTLEEMEAIDSDMQINLIHAKLIS